MKKIFLPFFLLFANFCIGQVDLNLGLRAYYPFSGNANDVSGNNNNPVFNNASLTADRLGNPNSAYHFNGTNTYMKVLNNPTINMGNTMSISLWVKPMGFYTGQCYNNMLVMKGDADYLSGNYSSRFSDVFNGCTASPSITEERFFDGFGGVAINPIVQLNKWYSVVITHDGTTSKLYVDCVLQNSYPFSTSFTNLYDLYIGHLNSAQFPYWLNGDLDEIRLYDRALNQDEVNTLGDCPLTTSCNNWLRTQAVGESVTVGDLDVSGNQITVEANFNCSSFPLTRPDKQEDIVSKHANTTDINYVLRMDLAGITTTNGQFLTPIPCDNLVTNKTYHVAMVYNGSSLKFYRDGFLMSQIAATGNLVLNNWMTTIGDYAVNNPVGTNFLGYINEVRIWNVARTQAELRTYMDASLPNPTTQTGLQAYYTFDNLVNKQGNATWNGTLNGAATINNINPNCTFVADSCAVTTSCNNWLSTPTHPSTVSIGNLNVTGNQITVETNFNCTNYTSSGLGFGGKLIGKHTNAANTCYALSPHAAEISTSNNGYVVTYDNCPFELNKTYHVAMVYDGTSLKFYRNGSLMSQIPCSGNISTNSLLASIGNGPTSPLISQFFGYINEMRIWNVARTQAELQTYMNSSLPNPATQPGLLAYYTFDNLLNKQGNVAWNGTLNGGASINNTNPNCTFTPTPCPITATSVIINNYTPALALNPCNNILTVEDGTAYNVGDTVLLIQMKGAVIDSTNTAAFGTITDYKNSGNYEFNYVKSKTGNNIELTNALTRQYDIPLGKVQLIRVPYYINLTTTDTLTCLPWDGSMGGVLVFNVQNTLTLHADIDVSGKGFRGSQPIPNVTGTAIFNQTDYAYPANPVDGTRKGEGAAEVSENLVFCRGPLFSGGGGGNSSNSGGGGGGNAGTGGKGGNEWGGSSTILTNGGLGGNKYTYSGATNKIFMGGGGGAGQANDATGTAGGNGGGIVIITANNISPNSKKITAAGAQGVDCLNLTVCADGVGGGGAGGTVLLNAQSINSNFQIQTNGGKGADNNINGPNVHGPGGGGGGGSLLVNSGTLLAVITHTTTGGAAGRAINHANTNWGAVAGNSGNSSSGFIVPVSTVSFTKNIDSVRIKDSLLNCNGFDFKGLAYINTAPIASWQWYFGDGGQATTQNTSHAYTAAGLYTVKLIVSDLNGCMDSIAIDVNALPGVNAEAGADTAICTNATVSVTLHGTAVGGPYLWSPAIYLNNPNIQNPVATISSTTTFYLNVTGAASCTSIDSVTIYISPLPLVDTRSDTAICRSSPLVLLTNSNATSYQWSPAIYVSNPNIASPNYIDNFSHWVYVTGTTLGCSATDSLYVTINALPVVETIADTILCQDISITLTTTGAQTYSWSPTINLSNPNIASPVFSGSTGNAYTVTGTDATGCKNTDSVVIEVSSPIVFKQPPAFSICEEKSVRLDGNNGNQVSYLWSPATYLSNPAIINPLANPPQTTLYTLLVTDTKCGQDSLFTTLLTVVPAPVINAGKSNDIDCAFRSATLFASGGNQYLWSPSTGLNNPTIANPVAIPVNTQTYTVLVTDATGCTNTDMVTVFNKRTASLARYMPNAFTPDGNGINDCYGLKSWMYMQQLQFYIFNRYGEQVFGTTNPNTCWDGSYKGKPALAGTYVYVIKAKTDCGDEEQKGSFILIR